jgi:Cdc6-like AAA superfamily ATPase
MRGNGLKLAAITKELAQHWRETKEHWSDAKSQEFEHKYLEELFASVDKAVTVIDELDKLVSKIRSDCE